MALIASTTATGRWGDGKITPPLSHPHPQEGSAQPSYEELTTWDVESQELATRDMESEEVAKSDMKDVRNVHPFITAAAEEDEVRVKYFLNDSSLSVDSMAPTVRIALQQAAKNDNQRTVDIILQSNMFGVSERDVEWLTPLYFVYARNSTKSSSELLDTILNYRQNGYNDSVPLLGMRWNHPSIYPTFIQILLERHANGRVIPPEAISIEQEHQAAVNILLENSPDTKLMSHFGVLPLVFAAETAHEGVVNLLLDKGADIEAKDHFGRSPLLLAVWKGHEAIIKLLLNNKADIEAKDKQGHTPLAVAVHFGHDAIVKLLLDNKADIEAKDKCGHSPLAVAVYFGHEVIVKLLLDNKADIEAKDRRGHSPLAIAAWEGHEAIVKLLLDNKADIEAKDKRGRSPLMLAVYFGHEAIVKLLLDNKADIEAKDKRGRSPLTLAVDIGRKAITWLLLENQAKDNLSRSLVATNQGAGAVVKRMIKRGKDPT
ncbi:unnamed protein product [Clonostachys rosea f. rosea IK726]|nr:unnamed protein product [Clonostachys rosea f. rosea IK726]